MAETEYIERAPLIEAYDAEHVGPPGRARELIVNAPAVDADAIFRGMWRNVKDYPPPDRETVIVWVESLRGFATTGQYSKYHDAWSVGIFLKEAINYWMPLPPCPIRSSDEQTKPEN